MEMNRIGKFESRRLINEFDAELIRRYGMNMLDASISRFEALCACQALGSPGKAAEFFAARCGCGIVAA